MSAVNICVVAVVNGVVVVVVDSGVVIVETAKTEKKTITSSRNF